MGLKNWCNIFVFSLLVFVSAGAQEAVVLCINPEFQQEVDSYLTYDVPFISVADAFAAMDKYTFLDAREKNEFEVSHIKNAKYIGYDDFDMSTLDDLDKNQPIVIYCSIGYRSEKIGDKLKNAGFSKVYNLYGSIFEWVNQHHPVYDTSNQQSLNIHTYNKKWSKWVTTDDVKKVW